MEIAHTEWHVATDVSDAEAFAVQARDRVWNCFAIADLAPPFRAYSQFAIARQDNATDGAACLVLRHPALTVLSPYGPDQGVAAILAQLALPERTILQAQAAHLPLLETYYRFLPGWRELLRMAVSAQTFRPPTLGWRLKAAPGGLSPTKPAFAGWEDDLSETKKNTLLERLMSDDLAALHKLYALYPDSIFRDELLHDGIFYGIRAGERLIAAGGTHVVALPYGIAVLGNIFTHPDERGQGYASAITAALVSDLFAQGCRDVVLNVTADNSSAISVYTLLGFQTHCHFWSGLAELT